VDTRVVDNIYNIHQLSPERAREQMRKSSETAMEPLLAADFAEGVTVTATYTEGIPPVEVKEVAERIAADLIVMGTHGKTGLSHLLYGTTSEGVLRGAPCPVLTVNP
jgi:nucleotide-binding universal stress UspA family protein